MIYIASDHAGFKMKGEIVKYLLQMNIKYVDIGPHEYEELDDYPDFIIPAAQKVAGDPDNNLGIVLGGSGQGEVISANKVRGIRAAIYNGGPMEIVSLTRTHNNANVLSLGARFISAAEAIEAVKLWLETTFSGEERHARRIAKISTYESSQMK